MFSRSVNLALLSAAAFTAVQAQYAGDLAAVAACKGFLPGAFKCLTDVSFVQCNGGYEVEQFVAAGTHCEQGKSFEKLDAVDVPGDATATRIFTQYDTSGILIPSPTPVPSSAGAVAPPPAPSDSSAAASGIASSSDNASAVETSGQSSPPPPSSSPFSPTSSATANTISFVSGFAVVTTSA